MLWIRDVYPGSLFLPIPDPGSRFPDPKTATKDRCENFSKLNIILFLICWRKKFGPIFQELLKFLPNKLSPSPQKYGFGSRDSGSEIREPEKTYSGSRIQGSKRHRIPDPQHWWYDTRRDLFKTKINIPDPQHCIWRFYYHGLKNIHNGVHTLLFFWK